MAMRSVFQRRFFSSVSVNGRTYNRPISKPIVAMCVSGTVHDYILAAREADMMPNWQRILVREGFRNCGITPGIMPSLTV
jgi:hypothetical protein